MANIYESIGALITPAHTKTAAAVLGEHEEKVAAGVKIILPSLLAHLLKAGDTPEIEEVMREGKKIKAWENIEHIWQGSGVDEHINLGERIENRLLSPHTSRFNTIVGHAAGLRSGNTDRLTNWVSGTIGAWFAHQMASGKSLKTLLGDLASEKEALKRHIPSEMAQELGLASLLGISAAAHKPAAAMRSTVKPAVPAPKKKSLAWLWWLLGLIIAALIICWAVRSCHPKKVEPVAATTVVTETTVVHKAPAFETIPMVLPDGTKINMYRGDLEESLRAYLDSDKFKNATEAELRSVWFEFTDIDFEFDDATTLMKGSPERLHKVVDVLKKYPDVKVKVGSFGDRKGGEEYNFELSDKRAEVIMGVLRESGFPAKNLSFEGFGKQFAKVPAEATDAQRAPDRDVAMRFTR